MVYIYVAFDFFFYTCYEKDLSLAYEFAYIVIKYVSMSWTRNGHRRQWAPSLKTLISLDVNNKCSDQPAHTRSLINAFVVSSLKYNI